MSGRVKPNTITMLGVIPAVGAGIAFGYGHIRIGGVLIGISGIFDLMDGLVARLGHQESRFGALLDSTVDRYCEIAMFIGLVAFFRDSVHLYGVILALAGSLMVSYVKARAEGLGSSCDVGVLQRPERLLILMIGALLGPGLVRWAIWILAVMANFTAIERLLKVRTAMRLTASRRKGEIRTGGE
jgi:phosphatidylglycerophosphate synthase